MKITQIALSALVGFAAVAALHAASPKLASRADVTFTDPEKFTDAADGQRGSDWGRAANLEEIKTYLEDRANNYVPEGQKLQVIISDVDLAGEIEPWRSPQMQDARIIKDIYAPRIELNFKLTDAAGVVVKEGSRHLTDLTFMMNIYPNRNDRRVYEKGLIDNWLRTEFGGNKKK